LFFSRRSLPLNPYPSHYRPAFASSLLLYLLPCRRTLRVAFPRPIGYGEGETTGLPRSADVPEWVGRICTPVARHLRRRSSGPPDLATYLLVQAVQQLALVLCDDAYDALPGLAIPLNPGSRPPLLLAVAVAAHALAALPRPHVPIRGGYVVPALISR